MPVSKDIYQAGKREFQQGNYRSAKEVFHKILQVKPNLPSIWNNLGICYVKLGNIDRAIEMFKKGLEYDQTGESLYHNLGRTYFHCKKYKKVLETFRTAVRYFPDNALFWNNIGFAYSYVGDIEKSIEAYKKALEINPQYEKAWKNLCRGYGKLGVEFNFEDLKGATEVAWYFLAKALAESERFEESLYAVNQCLQLNHGFHAAFNFRKQIRSSLKQKRSRQKLEELQPPHLEKKPRNQRAPKKEGKLHKPKADSPWTRFKQHQKKFRSRFKKKKTESEERIKVDSEEYEDLPLDEKYQILQARFKEKKEKNLVDLSSEMEHSEELQTQQEEQIISGLNLEKTTKTAINEKQKLARKKQKAGRAKRPRIPKEPEKPIYKQNQISEGVKNKKGPSAPVNLKIKGKYYKPKDITVAIDGANVALDKSKGEKDGKLVKLQRLQAKLEALGITDIKIFSDSKLRYRVENQKLYDKMVDNGKINQTPAGTEADEFILKYAKQHDTFIISNDLFRDYYGDFGERWIKQKRLAFNFMDGDVYLGSVFKG